jgi:hypothetical protein
LDEVLRIPSDLSYGQLRLHPFWDPLRGDPRFEQLVEESKKPLAVATSGRLSYRARGPSQTQVSNAVDYAKVYSRSHDAVIRVYD